jgi:hypothetical protein
MKRGILLILILFFLILLGGNTHRILPANIDDCQTDMTHEGHVNDLPMFHCIGHTEYEVNYDEEGLLRVAKWDHIHEWMTLEWHLEKGFSREHALRLLRISNHYY